MHLLRTLPRQSRPSPKAKPKPTEKSPDARTTPPTSLFLPMKLSNSDEPESRSCELFANPAGIPPAEPARTRNPQPMLRRREAGTTESSPPHLSVGRSTHEVPETAAVTRSVSAP